MARLEAKLQELVVKVERAEGAARGERDELGHKLELLTSQAEEQEAEKAGLKEKRDKLQKENNQFKESIAKLAGKVSELEEKEGKQAAELEEAKAVVVKHFKVQKKLEEAEAKMVKMLQVEAELGKAKSELVNMSKEKGELAKTLGAKGRSEEQLARLETDLEATESKASLAQSVL